MSSIALAVVMLAGSIVAAVVKCLMEREVEHRVSVLPMALLRLARRLVPARCRDELYGEWLGELHEAVRDASVSPLERMVFGVRFSAGMIRSGRQVARELHGFRGDVTATLAAVDSRLWGFGDVGALGPDDCDDLRASALELRDLLDRSPRAFARDHTIRLVAAAAHAGKLCVDHRDERLGRELAEAARGHAGELDPDNPSVLRLGLTTGYALLQLGAHRDAERILGDVHARFARTFGPTCPAALDAQRLRAWCLQEQGRLHDAEDALIRLLRVLECQPEPALQLHVRCMLGWVQCRQGRFDSAELTYGCVIAGRTILLGPDHMDTLDARHSLGKVLFERGAWRRARLELTSVAVDRERRRGRSHPDTMESAKYATLAGARLGHRAEAVAALRRLLASQTRSLGPRHPSTVDTRNRLDELTRETP